jgi:hypothetical protein
LTAILSCLSAANYTFAADEFPGKRSDTERRIGSLHAKCCFKILCNHDAIEQSKCESSSFAFADDTFGRPSDGPFWKGALPCVCVIG